MRSLLLFALGAGLAFTALAGPARAQDSHTWTFVAVIEGDSLFIDTHPENFACDAGTSECTVTTRRVYATPQEDGDGKTYTAYEARTVYACGSSAQLSLGGAQLDAAGQIVGEHQSDQADFEDVPMEYPGAAALYRAACDLTE